MLDGDKEMIIDSQNRHLLDAMQSGFPVVSRPWRALGDGLGLSENETIERVSGLKASGVIRRTSAIFDSARIGYKSVLAAFAPPDEFLGEAAEKINEHPGVSHNYERDHEFSLWSALTVPPKCDLYAHAQELARLAQAKKWIFLPSLRLYKIGVKFQMATNTNNKTPCHKSQENSNIASSTDREIPLELTDLEISAIRALQRDLPLEQSPFQTLAALEGLSEDKLLGYAKMFLDTGRMRRYAAILRHRQAGYTHNVMSVWAVPESRAEEAGRAMAEHPAVSHCYQRPTAPGWRWTHFAMTHGRSEVEINKYINEISEMAQIGDYQLLRTVREFKKIRVQYFTPDIESWEKKHGLKE